MPVTLQDIADKVGLSIATVSRALAGTSSVAPETRDLVLSAAEEMGYHPNVMARRLQKQRTDTLGFVIPTFGPRFSDPFFSELLAGIGNEAAEHNYDLLVSTCAPGPKELQGYHRLVEERRVDGLLVVRTRRRDPRIAYLLEREFPFVAFGRSDLDVDFPYLDEDGYQGMRVLTQHLIDQGHRRIAYISAPWELVFSQYRFDGYRAALEANGLACDDSLVMTGCLTDACGYEAGRELLCRENWPSAVIACNDLMALGVISAAQECGLKVGQDVAVAGFDDIPLAKFAQPSLTTVRQPIYQIGRRICSMLLQLLQGEVLENPHVLMEPELIIRSSTQKLVVKGGDVTDRGD